MRIKKIDDNLLHQMISDGKPQREMARFFGVSDAAISKKIKRLNQSEPPESFTSLAPKKRKFVLSKIEGKSNTASAIDAFNCGSVASAKTIGGRLARDPDVSAAIGDLMHAEGLGRRYRVRKLREVIESKDLGITCRGLDLANKLTGEYAPEKIAVAGKMAATLALIEKIRAMEKGENKFSHTEGADDSAD